MRRLSSACGGGSETMPIDAICRSVFSMRELATLQVVAAVGEVEGLVDEREIRDDIADDGVLEHRPVLPRGIMRVTAADACRGARLRARSSTGPRQPSIKPAPTAPSAGARTGVRCGPSGSAPRMCWTRRHDSCSSSKRTATRAATSPSLRTIFAGATAAHTARTAGRCADRTPGRSRGRQAR